MDETRQEKAIDVLRDWSKWLIGVNVFSATGCVIVLERDVPVLLQPLLVGAIVLPVLCGCQKQSCCEHAL